MTAFGDAALFVFTELSLTIVTLQLLSDCERDPQSWKYLVSGRKYLTTLALVGQCGDEHTAVKWSPHIFVCPKHLISKTERNHSFQDLGTGSALYIRFNLIREFHCLFIPADARLAPKSPQVHMHAVFARFLFDLFNPNLWVCY